MHGVECDQGLTLNEFLLLVSTILKYFKVSKHKTLLLLLFVNVCGLQVALGLLVLLEVSLLAEKDPAGGALERPDPFVNPLVHVAVAGGGEDLEKGREGGRREVLLFSFPYFFAHLSARLARVLPLF